MDDAQYELEEYAVINFGPAEIPDNGLIWFTWLIENDTVRAVYQELGQHNNGVYGFYACRPDTSFVYGTGYGTNDLPTDPRWLVKGRMDYNVSFTTLADNYYSIVRDSETLIQRKLYSSDRYVKAEAEKRPISGGTCVWRMRHMNCAGAYVDVDNIVFKGPSGEVIYDAAAEDFLSHLFIIVCRYSGDDGAGLRFHNTYDADMDKMHGWMGPDQGSSRYVPGSFKVSSVFDENIYENHEFRLTLKEAGFRLECKKDVVDGFYGVDIYLAEGPNPGQPYVIWID
jgi:hypothetical protein